MSNSYDRKDHFYHRAKDEGYRSRAAFKLMEIDQKHQILKKGGSVLDLGAWPGGWLQVAQQKVGPSGKVVGIDLVKIDPLPGENILLLQGDVRDEDLIKQSQDFAGGPFDVVVSDMSPKLSGIKEADRAGAVACAELALWIAEQVLAPGGSLVMKVFKSNETEEFIRQARPRFQKVARSELDSTRKTSNEFYVIALGRK